MAQPEIKTEEIASIEDFRVWKAYEPDEEVTWHIEFGKVTVHFFAEEWEEFIELKNQFVNIPLKTTGVLGETDNYYASCEKTEAGDIYYTIELCGDSPDVFLDFFEEDWKLICDMLRPLQIEK